MIPETTQLVRDILVGYRLPVRGIHGVPHWGRVLENGLRIAELTGADQRVLAMFSIFHDSRRVNEDSDYGHGRRGSDLARTMRDRIALDDDGFGLLTLACDLHTDGLTKGDPTVQACWDADRLDLGRVGIEPEADRLCTDVARNLIAWANERAMAGYEPPFVAEWLEPASSGQPRMR